MVGGAPIKDIDIEELEKLVAMGCPNEEIASWFGVSKRTLYNRCQEEPFKTVYSSARHKLNIRLRRKQLEMALKGNVAMLIWLGKVMLGQKDAMRLSGDENDPLTFDGKIEIIHVEPILQELAKEMNLGLEDGDQE